VSSAAEEHNPQPAVEQFLALHGALSRATVIAESLTKATTSPDQSAAGDACTADEDTLAVAAAERRRRAASWVGAGLATDLSAFSLYNLRPTPANVASPLAVVLVGRAGEGLAVCKVTVVPGEGEGKGRLQRCCWCCGGGGAPAGVGAGRRRGGEVRAGAAARGGVEGLVPVVRGAVPGRRRGGGRAVGP
jgi:hypothetical protein